VTILHLIDSLYRGGAQKVVVHTAKLFSEHSHIICIWENVNHFEEELAFFKNIKVVKLPFGNIFSLPQSYLFVRRIVKEYKVDVIHSHMFVPNILARLMPRRRVKVLCTYHGECFEFTGIKRKVVLEIEKRMFARASANIFVSQHVKKYVLQRLDKSDQGVVLYNFIEDCPRKKQYAVEQKIVKIVATSNNHSYKNYNLLLNSLLQSEGMPIHLYIYGDLMDDLKQFVHRNNLNTMVSFMGVHSNIRSVLLDYDAFIIVSNSGEGFSLSVLEAMNAGIAIISSDIPQFVEAVGENSPLLFKSDDVHDLCRVLKRLINDSEILRRSGKMMLERSSYFSMEVFCKQLSNLYNRGTVFH
jgi:glycosyltransferase involved in cell wall biosynthesis